MTTVRICCTESGPGWVMFSQPPRLYSWPSHILLCPQMPPPPSGHRYLKENFSNLLPSAYLFPIYLLAAWLTASRVILVLCCSQKADQCRTLCQCLLQTEVCLRLTSAFKMGNLWLAPYFYLSPCSPAFLLTSQRSQGQAPCPPLLYCQITIRSLG